MKNMLPLRPGVDYVSRGGLRIRIYAIDGADPYPIHGAVLSMKSGWIPIAWLLNGSFLPRNEHFNDIVGVFLGELAIDIAELKNAVANLNRILNKLEGQKYEHRTERTDRSEHDRD